MTIFRGLFPVWRGVSLLSVYALLTRSASYSVQSVTTSEPGGYPSKPAASSSRSCLQAAVIDRSFHLESFGGILLFHHHVIYLSYLPPCQLSPDFPLFTSALSPTSLNSTDRPSRLFSFLKIRSLAHLLTFSNKQLRLHLASQATTSNSARPTSPSRLQLDILARTHHRQDVAQGRFQEYRNPTALARCSHCESSPEHVY